LAEASEEGQGPRRAVEPMMMMKDICPAFHVYTVQEIMFSSQSILRIQTTGNRLKFVHYINSSEKKNELTSPAFDVT
jgi:hypothetical protein